MKKSYTLAQIATCLQGEYHGDANCILTGISPLQEAQPGHISFLHNPKYRKELKLTKASAVIIAPEDLSACPVNAIVVKNPYLGYAKAAALFATELHETIGIHPTAVIGQNCSIAASASIGPYTVIANGVVIGERTVIGPHCIIGERSVIAEDVYLWPQVTLYHETQLGARTMIHSGAVIGSDGFGLAKNEQGGWHKIPQLGCVIIGSDVEIGANTTIDRGALGNTIIGDGVKLDNQIQIGHNVQIGDHTAIAGTAAIAGSTKIGNHCTIGGGAAIAGHLTIADFVTLTGTATVPKSLLEPGAYGSGIPAMPYEEFRKNAVRFRKLDQMARRLIKLEQLLQEREES